MLQLGFLGTATRGILKGGSYGTYIHIPSSNASTFPYFTSYTVTIPGTSSYLYLKACMAELILKYNHSVNRLILQSINQSINQIHNQVNLCLLTPI